MYIKTNDHLERLCEQARSEGIVALDVEFVREHSFTPKMALIQLAVKETCAIVDPFEIHNLKPLFDVVCAPDIIKVLHAAGQDMEVLFRQSRRPPLRVFDTQIAAAYAGLGEQQSYGRLVEKLIGVSLPKSESYSDWLQRPLSPKQVAYALDDVRYLLTLYEQLCERLADLRRASWVEEEFRKFEELEQYQRDPRKLFRRIRRATALSSEGLSILRELADWRDQEARRRDRPHGSVLRDDVLVEIARKAPKSIDELQRMRGFPPHEIGRSGSVLVALVRRGLAISDDKRPIATQRYRLKRTEELMVRFLDTYMKSLCHAEKLPPSRVASREDLERFAYHYRQGQLQAFDSPLLRGWRAELVGKKLLEVLKGRVSLHLNPGTGELEASPRLL